VPEHEIVFAADAQGEAEVSVIVPLYNYAQFVGEALDSVRAQTLASLDLVVVDDRSTDDSLAVARAWAERHAARFNRVLVLRNAENAGLGLTRNVGFANAETPWVLPLDADNRLLPPCLEELLRAAQGPGVGAGFVYPLIREIGERDGLIGTLPYQPARLIGMAYIDAMALVSLAAWAHVGGYGPSRLGWEDYEFWCRLAERGVGGCQAGGGPLAEYRVHAASMLATTTNRRRVKRQVIAEMQEAHPWLHITAFYDVADPDDDRPDTA
jgi:glycosyltransferase involved in cell wall biosynthesis